MRRSKPIALTLLGALALGGADAQISKDLSKFVKKAPAQVVDPKVIVAKPAVDPNVIAAAATPAVVPMSPDGLAADTVTTVAPAAVSSAAANPAATVVVDRVKRGQLLYVKLNAAQEREVRDAVAQRLGPNVPSLQVATLPGLLRVESARGTELQLKALALPGQPLRYDQTTNDFKGSVKLGVIAVNDTETDQAFTAPVAFEILESNVATPASLEVTESSPPFKEVAIRAPQLTGPFTVHVASKFEPRGAPVTIPVEPTLLVRLDRAAIQGYGLETARVSVQLVGADPTKMPMVEFSSRPSAFFDPSRIKLEPDGTASTTLRSDGTGTVDIGASVGAVTAAMVPIEFLAPTRTLIAGLLGGLGGGLVRLLGKGSSKRTAASFAKALLVAVLFGLGAFALYAIGVNVLGVQPTVSVGTIVVIALSFLGALLWTGRLSTGKP